MHHEKLYGHHEKYDAYDDNIGVVSGWNGDSEDEDNSYIDHDGEQRCEEGMRKFDQVVIIVVFFKHPRSLICAGCKEENNQEGKDPMHI